MPSTLFTAATDIFVIAGAAAVASAALNSKTAPFRTSLGAECDDDALVSVEPNDTVGTPEQAQSGFMKHADHEKKVPIVTVDEVAVTPVVDMQEDDYFASAKAA